MLIQSRNTTQSSFVFVPRRDCHQLLKYIANLDQEFIKNNNLGDIFVKNFEQTHFCDNILNLENERGQIIQQINHDDKNRYDRLLKKGKEMNWVDSTVATETFTQHFGKLRMMIVQSFPFYERFSFAAKDWFCRNFVNKQC